MLVRHGLVLAVFLLLLGCSKDEHLNTGFFNSTCIKPLIGYRYLTCTEIGFQVNDERFYIPKHFETDLASIPKVVWPIMAPAHSSLIRPAIVHDWFYRKTCIFTRLQADLIFYYMLRGEGVSRLKASIMYYGVRLFGWKYFTEDYCDEEFERMD